MSFFRSTDQRLSCRGSFFPSWIFSRPTTTSPSISSLGQRGSAYQPRGLRVPWKGSFSRFVRCLGLWSVLSLASVDEPRQLSFTNELLNDLFEVHVALGVVPILPMELAEFSFV